jgi:hypothetical protein
MGVFERIRAGQFERAIEGAQAALYFRQRLGAHAAQITALSGAITTYAANITAPGDQSNENAGALQAIVANIGKLAGLRHQVQLAAEQAFPWRNSGVASIRQSFLLPTDRPMPGK